MVLNLRNDVKYLLNNIENLENKLNYRFKKKSNIILALTHSSFANESKNENMESNERLEFLGDAVLNLVISEYIYSKYPDMPEGDMTKNRANIVCETSLEKCSTNIKIGKYLLLGKGEEITGGRTRTSILSDLFEAVIGAVFIDGGMSHAASFIKTHMRHIIQDSIDGYLFMDYKTKLQEKVQKDREKKIAYKTVKESGPDHNKKFIIQVRINGIVMGTGKGKNKKEAEQNAARDALKKNFN